MPTRWPSAAPCWPGWAIWTAPRPGPTAAIVFAFRGRPGEAMDWLEHAFDSAPEWQRRLALWMQQDQDIDQMRDLPRFKALLNRLRPLLAPRTLDPAA